MSCDLKQVNREVLEEFIEKYRELPCLWNVKLREYHDKAKREAGYNILLNIYRKIDVNATRDVIVKKINSLRTNYRKEKKKIYDSLQSGIGTTNEMYKPSLWYFHLFEFLCEQDMSRKSSSNLNETEEYVDDPFENVEHLKEESVQGNEQAGADIRILSSTSGSIAHSSTQKRGNPAKTSKQNRRCDSLLATIEHHFKKPKLKKDRYDVFGKNVAMKMQDIQNSNQKLLVEKIINDALFMAETGQLYIRHSIRESPSSSIFPNNMSFPTQPSHNDNSSGTSISDHSDQSLAYVTNFNNPS